MSDLLIPSFLVSDVSESLRLLTKNERCEQIAQVAHQKWATMSDSLRSLRGNERLWVNCSGWWANEWIAHFFERIVHLLIFGQKRSDSLGKLMSKVPALSLLHWHMDSACWHGNSVLYIVAVMQWHVDTIDNEGEQVCNLHFFPLFPYSTDF